MTVARNLILKANTISHYDWNAESILDRRAEPIMTVARNLILKANTIPHYDWNAESLLDRRAVPLH